MNANGKWWIAGIVIVVILAVGGAVVMSKPKTQNQLTVPVATSPTPEAVTGTVAEVVVEGSNYKFSPATLKVKKGDTVKLAFKSTGGIHNLVIDEFGVETSQLGEGEEEEVEFVADKTGTFEYYCSVANHRAMGMTGKLVVE